jgi:hypothetical protein
LVHVHRDCERILRKHFLAVGREDFLQGFYAVFDVILNDCSACLCVCFPLDLCEPPVSKVKKEPGSCDSVTDSKDREAKYTCVRYNQKLN